MSVINEKTIAAISTGAAPGGIGIVRISGENAREIADRVFRSVSGKRIADMKGYTAAFGGAYTSDGEKLDDVVALVFAKPKSYTGEDVVELSCHGGLYVTRRILREVLDAGAVPAGPGEFTRRAFLNGKVDLVEAEAVMELIGAGGEQAARAGAAGGSGVLSRRISEIRDGLLLLSSHLAAWADFPEEDVPEVEERELTDGLDAASKKLTELLDTFDKCRVFSQGVDTVIAGRPNVGKSTLMNLLTGRQRSIVTQFPGTTRDVVEDVAMFGGVPLRLADTAGIRDTSDPVETIGVELSRERVKTAQLILAVFDGSADMTLEDEKWIEGLDPARTVAIINKSDLPANFDENAVAVRFTHMVKMSASDGTGYEDLQKEIAEILGTNEFKPLDGALFTERQRDGVKRADEAVREALAILKNGMTWDAVTVCVEDAVSALYELTGERVSDEITDRVFEDFCVGK